MGGNVVVLHASSPPSWSCMHVAYGPIPQLPWCPPGTPLVPPWPPLQVIRIQPNEAIYLKVNNKVPGLGLRIDISRLDLSYKSKYNKQLPGEAGAAAAVEIRRGHRGSGRRTVGVGNCMRAEC